MAKADQLKALIRSHAEGDDARFYSIAMQVAAQEARGGRGRLAQDLRELVDQSKARRTRLVDSGRLPGPVPLAQPRGELAGLLVATYPKTRLTDMVLAERALARLQSVIREQRQRELLTKRGFSPLRKLLLVGLPGTGKTMTASALAGELAVPLLTIQLHSLITKFMGETAAKLRLVFDAIRETRGVYLFDEFDALGSDRGAKNDVGEIRRVLNSFLQFLEQDDSDSLILAATNHPGILDRALFRRFDAAVEYTLPSGPLVEAVVRNRLGQLDLDGIAWAEVSKAAKGHSHAEIVRACEQAAKDALLDDRPTVATRDLVENLAERHRPRE
jgi:SpoVK/Ycf46/Vps4 family AAA+-type ATPase